MRTFFTMVALLLCATVIEAQQEAHYTQFMYNNILNNPGFAGSRRVPNLTATYRNQWMGFQGNPISYLLSLDMPISNDRLGTGIVLGNQSEGITQRQYGKLVFSYAAIKTQKATLRMGMNMSVSQYRYDLQDPDIYVEDKQDASLQQETPRFINANVGIGVYFDTEKFYAGISIPNLNKNAIAIGANPASNTIGREQRHVYFMAGGLIPMGSGNLIFKPSLLYKYVANAPFSLDVNASVMIQKQFTVGASYRVGESGNTGDSIDFLGFVQATDKLGFGFSYDHTLSALKNYSSGTIEALVRYDFGPTNGLKNPRFFF